MKGRRLERVALRVHRVRQWLARNSPRQRRTRSELGRKEGLCWWLVYGSTRSGTSYMMRLIKSCALLYVSDWGLGMLFEQVPHWINFRSAPVHDYITFDPDRLLRDISCNILDRAYAGDGDQIDLVYKDAAFRPNEYQTLVMMWGEPERAIFCLRDPAGYMASAGKKFVSASLEHLQQAYVRTLDNYWSIGGDVFEYTSELTLAQYKRFLEPLHFAGKRLPDFRYTGARDEENTTADMWAAYHRIQEAGTT